MRNFILLLFILISFNLRAQENYAVSGTVNDEKSQPLPGATVFIASTQYATATDGSGKFNLNNLPAGTYSVVIKMLGYGTSTNKVTIQDKAINLAITLKENSIELATVNINGISDKDRKLYMAIFLENLLGKSANAHECKLLNPQDVRLNYSKKTFDLTAGSDKFLIIENKRTGYIMHYLLEDFTYGHMMVIYHGTLYFEEMKGSASQQKRWAANRKETYEGSITQFFKAALNNTFTQQGFVVYRMPDRKAMQTYSMYNRRIDEKYFTPLTTISGFFKANDANSKWFDLTELKKDSTELYIVYTKKDEPGDFSGTESALKPFFIMPNGQRSIIHPLADSVTVDNNGNLHNPYSILRAGYWTWGRTADFLPLDYKIPEELIANKKIIK